MKFYQFDRGFNIDNFYDIPMPEIIEEEIYYFGCVDQVGHGLHRKFQGHIVSVQGGVQPDFEQRFGQNGRMLDRTFCSPTNWGTYTYMESVVGPWYIVSWCDFSVDKRPGSHSTFVGRTGSHDKLMERARAEFPEIFKRQPEVKKGLHIFK
jgi:hypothetical protein